jgi:hypothetical protein
MQGEGQKVDKSGEEVTQDGKEGEEGTEQVIGAEDCGESLDSEEAAQ